LIAYVITETVACQIALQVNDANHFARGGHEADIRFGQSVIIVVCQIDTRVVFQLLAL